VEAEVAQMPLEPVVMEEMVASLVEAAVAEVLLLTEIIQVLEVMVLQDTLKSGHSSNIIYNIP
jgi:hypothetical protein